MQITNKTLAGKIQLYSQLLEINGENPFRLKAYKFAYPLIRNYKGSLADMTEKEILDVKGLGKNFAGKIQEIKETGSFQELEDLKHNLPQGLSDLLQVSGLGASKVKTLWKEYGIDDLDKLIAAGEKGELSKVKGIGEKSSEKILDHALFIKSVSGKLRMNQAEYLAQELEKSLEIGQLHWQGDWSKKKPIIEEMILYVPESALPKLEFLEGFKLQDNTLWNEAFQFKITISSTKVEHTLANHVIQLKDIKSLIHCHSQYSDGANTLEELVLACKERHLEYMLISDHSQSAGYANGLNEERILQQHREIDNLNERHQDFFIFKGIESDILANGALDYDDDVLSTFDLVIASVHSGLEMDEKTAMKRIINAIENPYTHILGHLTGRLLLKRKGYPLDMHKIIDACAANEVAIEINSNPNRLDIDPEFIPYLLEKGVDIFINPDAHYISGIDDIKYGVWAAAQYGLKPDNCVNTKNLNDFNKWISAKR